MMIILGPSGPHDESGRIRKRGPRQQAGGGMSSYEKQFNKRKTI